MLGTYFISRAWSFFSPRPLSFNNNSAITFLMVIKSPARGQMSAVGNGSFVFSLSNPCHLKRWHTENVLFSATQQIKRKFQTKKFFLPIFECDDVCNNHIICFRKAKSKVNRVLRRKHLIAISNIFFLFSPPNLFFLFFEKHSKMYLSQPVVLEINSSDMSRISAGSDRI